MTIARRNPLSREDLIEIWLYIATDNPAAADRLLDAIESKVLLLSSNPGLGVRRPDIAIGVRSFPVGNYLILYRQVQGGIDIVRVIHGQRDLAKIKLQ